LIAKAQTVYQRRQHPNAFEEKIYCDFAKLEAAADLYKDPQQQQPQPKNQRDDGGSIMKSPTPQVIIHELDTLKNYTFTVIFALEGKVGGQWLYCRHKKRDTWETAGGHIEPGETPLDCAKRELREETGAVKFTINPAFDYEVKTADGGNYGQVFYADIEELGELPAAFEMAEVKGFDTYPEKLTYPEILPVLYRKIQSWMGLD
jgi:8-oxo-dGTP diphosphatase